MNFKPANEVLKENNITVNLKKMSGDIISVTYDSNRYTLEELIKRDFIENSYRFSLFKNKECYNSDIDDELKEGDILDIFIFPKSFEVSIIYLEESLMFKTPNDITGVQDDITGVQDDITGVQDDIQAWSRGEFYEKYVISIEEKIENADHIVHTFYVRNEKYIPSSSVTVINEGKYDDEDHIIINGEKPIFHSINDIVNFLLRDLYNESICKDINDKILLVWNDT